MQKVREYEQHAAECRQIAAAAKDRRYKKGSLKIWLHYGTGSRRSGARGSLRMNPIQSELFCKRRGSLAFPPSAHLTIGVANGRVHHSGVRCRKPDTFDSFRQPSACCGSARLPHKSYSSTYSHIGDSAFYNLYRGSDGARSSCKTSCHAIAALLMPPPRAVRFV